jgi:Domain of unknown function (DUF4440)
MRRSGRFEDTVREVYIMKKIAVLLIAGLALVPAWPGQEPDAPLNPELQRQEIVNLENETVRAIQQNNGTFFRRVYSEDFIGTLSHGQSVNKAQFIDAIQTSGTKYDSFIASDIRVRFFRDVAVANSLWSLRTNLNGQKIGGQLRVTHVYVSSPRGWQAVASEATPLPPDVHLPL